MRQILTIRARAARRKPFLKNRRRVSIFSPHVRSARAARYADGVGILMISSDLPELLGMADRVIVMRAARTMGEFARNEATPDRVMALATGITERGGA